MRIAILASMLAVLSACSWSSSSPPPPQSATTVVVPAGSTVVCSDGTAPPCR
jgi:hypothetical protein